jgi:hypothetical protein
MRFSTRCLRTLVAAGALALVAPVVTAPDANAVENPLIKRAWTHLAPATSPPVRQLHVMAYDAVHRETVLFGGQSGPGTFHDDTWVWNGTTWTQRFPAHRPTARSGAVMAYDTIRQQVVLFGGHGYGPSDTQEAFSDTWTWDGTDWTEQHPLTSPAPRAFAAGAYDSVHGQIVLFGGQDVGHFPSGGYYSDTWTWTGVTWLNRVASGPGPGINAIMSDAPTVGGTLMHGNAYGETWAWNGVAWTSVTTSGPGPAGYIGFDPVSADVVRGGAGTPGSGTLAFDGVAWRAETPTVRAPDLYSTAGAYDTGNRRLVVFGGYDGAGLADATWTYGF